MSYPAMFGKYQLLERINVGGMAEVFKAKDFGAAGFERLLAIKRILPNMAEDEEFINMFIDEARIAVQLSHSNVVPIYELGKFENQYYIAMEYVPGKDLRQIFDRFRKRKETMPIAAAAYVVSKICEGLDYAHRKTDPTGRPLHVIHRDVSPQNVLVSYEGSVKITDFGIVKAEDRASKTQAGVLKGKFGYMSPEQVRGLEIDHRSDIFAVGILLYEALTGKRLFIGESDFATLEKVRNAEVVPPTQHNPAIPDALEKVVLRALARERDERYQWALELHDDLQQFLIEDNSVFNASKLSHLLKNEYRDEIAAEMQKMEEFLQMPAPPRETVAAASRSVPTADWGDHRAEKTMIFEQGMDELANAQTQVGQSLPEAAPAPAMMGQMLTPTEEAPRRRRPAAALVLAGVVSLMVLGAAGWLLFGTTSKEGTLVLTSTPIDTVDIFMDGELIGQKTPLIRPNVPAGEHRLLAKAAGYSDKTYRFELEAGGAPAEIKIEMTRSRAPVGGNNTEAILEITSDPPVAAVRLGGVPQASTPYTMTVRDTTHPVVLEVVKNGYATQTVSVSFGPQERHKAVNVKLVPTGDKATPDANNAKLMVRSRPEGAAIYLGGAEQGVTPKELTNLDPHQSYTIELTKEGYKSYEQVVHMGGRQQVAMQANMLQERRRSRSKQAAAPAQTCTGSGGKLSVMPQDVADCRVLVGRTNLGVAPFVKKDSPTGRCPVEVKCAGGKQYQTTRMIKAGTDERVIIKAEDWH